jgi:hypothetical protein
MCPLNHTTQWAFSPYTMSAHTVPDFASHPPGWWVADCGYRMPRRARLADEPNGPACEDCAAAQLRRAAPLVAAR